jgi:hypothetical protein
MLRLRDTRVVRVVQKGRHGAREFYNQKMQHCCSDGSAIRLPVRAPFVAAAVPVITCWCIAHSRVLRGRARVRIEYRLLLLQGSSIIFIQRGYCCASAVHTRVAGVSEPSRAGASPIVVAGHTAHPSLTPVPLYRKADSFNLCLYVIVRARSKMKE